MVEFRTSSVLVIPGLLLFALATTLCTSAFAEPTITEFMAANGTTLADEDGAYSDWIEIHNPSPHEVILGGWSLTDNPNRPTKWTFPDVTLPANAYLVVFASGKDRRDPGRPLHTNFSLSASGEYLALVNPDGSTPAVELTFPEQFRDVAYGLERAPDGLEVEGRFLERPTPGAPNSAATVPPLSSVVNFSRGSGLFTGAFNVHLSGAGPDEHIRYILVPTTSQGAAAGRHPTPASPRYNGPITVTESTIIRAAVFSADDRTIGPTSTVHYLRAGSNTTSFNTALPLVVLGMHGYGELEENGTPYPGWTHLFIPRNDQSPFRHQPAMSSAARLRIRGNSSSTFPKKGYSLNLLDSSGDDNRQPLLGMPSSDEWALISPWNYDRTYIHNAFIYGLSNSMGRWAPRTRFVEVFFDGDGTLDPTDYAGISLLSERVQIDPDRVAIEPLSTSDVFAPAITGGYLLKIDVPDTDEWSFITDRGIPNLDSASVIVASPKAAKLPDEQRAYIRDYVQKMEDALFAGQASGWRDRRYLDYIDFNSWVDHHLLQVFSGNIDALAHSAFFHKDRGGKLAAGPVWDFDRALGSYDPRTEKWDTWNGGPVEVWEYGWYGVISKDPEFMQSWVDRWQSLRRDELSDGAMLELVDSLSASVTPEAAARDAARWPDNLSPTGKGFLGEIARLRDWLLNRSSWIDRQFVAAPRRLDEGDWITFVAPNGAALAYTVDGSDPRALGGELAANAKLTAGPLTLPATSLAQVRSYRGEMKDVFPGSPWSSAIGGPSSPPLVPKARLVNISARGSVGTGESALIAGVVVADTEGKRYLARAVGPALAAFGASGTVPDPQLSVYTADGLEIHRNNGWQHSRDAGLLPTYAKAVGAFPLPTGSADSALASTFQSGRYTLQVTTPTQQPGIGLAELYELDNSGRTANLSTRAYVRSGDGVLIGGFVVQGPAYKRMLIRAVGPTLTGFGVDSALQDPVLTIFTGQTVVASNDRWSDDAQAVTAAERFVGAFPLAPGSNDAAVLLTLAPGAYTVEVNGKSNSEGVALLEIYDLP